MQGVKRAGIKGASYISNKIDNHSADIYSGIKESNYGYYNNSVIHIRICSANRIGGRAYGCREATSPPP